MPHLKIWGMDVDSNIAGMVGTELKEVAFVEAASIQSPRKGSMISTTKDHLASPTENNIEVYILTVKETGRSSSW